MATACVFLTDDGRCGLQGERVGRDFLGEVRSARTAEPAGDDREGPST